MITWLQLMFTANSFTRTMCFENFRSLLSLSLKITAKNEVLRFFLKIYSNVLRRRNPVTADMRKYRKHTLLEKTYSFSLQHFFFQPCSSHKDQVVGLNFGNWFLEDFDQVCCFVIKTTTVTHLIYTEITSSRVLKQTDYFLKKQWCCVGKDTWK